MQLYQAKTQAKYLSENEIKFFWEEGKEEKAVETAEKMILRNKPLSEIIEFSGLPEKDICRLAKKLSEEIVL